MKKAMAILWPSLLFGAIGTVLFFSILVWSLAAGSSCLTWLIERRDARR